MRPIGGELELRNNTIFSYVTDSGRSSIRLYLNSDIKDKKFLLPDFLCEVILHVFNEYKVKYELYKVKEDLSIDIDSIKNINYDAIYVINYFGKRHDISGILLQNPDTLIIEDCVFLPIVEKPENIKNWIGFNSFRKMSYLADGSIIKSTIKLNEKNILKKESNFSSLKYAAKNIKYGYIHEEMYSEKQYLALFEKGEKLIDEQTTINTISDRSSLLLFDFYAKMDIEYQLRKKNYQTLDLYLNQISINIESNYNSHYILLVEERDALRNYLFKKNIFLPVHWPKINGIENSLYIKIISIPLFSTYNQNDMERIAENINNFYK